MLASGCPSVEDICWACIAAWGGEAQILTAIEELAELIKELARWEARGLKDDTYDKLVDEMADVLNMWHQMESLIGLVFLDKDVGEDIYTRSVYKFQRVYDKLPEEPKEEEE